MNKSKINKFTCLLLAIATLSVNLISFGMDICQAIKQSNNISDKIKKRNSLRKERGIAELSSLDSFLFSEEIVSAHNPEKLFSEKGHDAQEMNFKIKRRNSLREKKVTNILTETNLSSLTKNSNTECVQRLIINNNEVDKNLNRKDKFEICDLLFACSEGRIDDVRKILKNEKIEINQVDIYGRTPLCLACYKGYTNVAKVLLKNKDINVNLADKGGFTPLYWAEYYDQIEIKKDLLERGATLYPSLT